ncbi:hypothetical protein [Chitinophaga solisilvae]|uniref:hypothetical protein n=1 Tax=Chitinophaga solisilvae TaxID=1233460 RepID=UPI00136DAEC3|nr:hypothetical protein [Chitinophaga solisilvae]
MMIPRYRWLICLLFVFQYCKQPAPRQVTPAFYYWKQAWTGNGAETRYLRQLPAKKLYIKMFDVVQEEVSRKPVPVAIFKQLAPLPDSVDIIPVIFLMNNIWEAPDTALAANAARLLEQLCAGIPPQRIPEIQIDCDWTKTSRDQYFHFLQQLPQQPFFRQRKISATIRMHQVKFTTSSGIPPVDKGLLMCYNMGDLRKAGDHNSILEPATVQAYIGQQRVAEYPVPLDIALPLFDWSVLFDKGRYEGILRNAGMQELSDTSLFAHSGKLLYTVRKDSLLNGYPLKKGQVIRRETTTSQALEAVARLVAAQRQAYDPVVIFYHLDSVTLHNYPPDELQKIYRLFN